MNGMRMNESDKDRIFEQISAEASDAEGIQSSYKEHVSSTDEKLPGSTVPLALRYSLFLFDLDGVIYRGKEPCLHSAKSLKQIPSQKIYFITNNASRPPQVVANQISSFGIVTEASHVITSTQAAVEKLKDEGFEGGRVLVVGSSWMARYVEDSGFTVVDQAKDQPDVVLQGWDASVGWEQLAQASYAIANGALYAVTNRDTVIPKEEGEAPGNGTLVNAVIMATGVEPRINAGKPHSAEFELAYRRYKEQYHESFNKTQVCMVGDQLDTDIKGANDWGCASVCVLTGAVKPRDLLVAPQGYRPMYIIENLSYLFEEIPSIILKSNPHAQAPSYATCETSWAQASPSTVDNGSLYPTSTIKITVSDNSVNALRCACELAWGLVDRGFDGARLELPTFEK